VTAVALSAGQRSVGCSSVDAVWARQHQRLNNPRSGLLLLIAIASPLPNPQTGFVTSVERGVDIN